MRVIDHSFTDPFFNLAAEAYLFHHSPEPVCMLWQNEPAVLIGKHQDVWSEVNRPFAEANHIHIARRFSGGGAVYQDLGNLNLTFIGQLDEDSPEQFTRWLARFLQTAGVPAIADTRQALFVEGRKISGSAQYVRRNRFLHHATLLFSADLDRLRLVLDPPAENCPTAAPGPPRLFTQSVKSPVANLSELLRTEETLDRFRGRLLQALQEDPNRPGGHGRATVRTVLNLQDINAIKRLRNEKYAKSPWNMNTYPL